jgi:hypothetical protein
MSEVRLVVRESDEDWSGIVHGSTAIQAAAALSADPVTLDELRTAMGRFERPDPKWRFLADFDRGLCDEPHDAGLIVIDLVARLILSDNTYAHPDHEGDLEYRDGGKGIDKGVRYHLADDWLIVSDRFTWKSTADRRRAERAAHPPRDPRAVIYGRPMLEFFVREAFAAFGRRDEIVAAVRAEWTQQARKRLADKADVAPEEIDASLLTDDEIVPKTWSGHVNPFQGTIKNIHASWLMTPRDDLGGTTPREIQFVGQDHVSRDMNDRMLQWSQLQHCPPGLSRTSHAFRFAPFDTHELVKLYDLIRDLLWSTWDRLTELSEAPNPKDRPDAMTVGDFLTTEIPRLEAYREAWLDTPDPEMHGRPPRGYIERERARIPETVSPSEAIHDPDCPCCQMMAELPGPMFCGLDSCNFDEDFAFDITHRTKEEWDEQQREYEDWSRRFDAQEEERKRLGVTDSARDEPVWTRSFVNDAGADVPLGIRVFGVGGHLAELIEHLRESAGSDVDETRQHIDRLNRDFGNLREILRGDDLAAASSLIEPVMARFVETLDAVGRFRPKETSRCEWLAEEVNRLLAPPPEDGPPPRFDEEMPF